MNWILIGDIIYLLVLVPVSLRIIHDTRSSSKTLAYLLLVIFLPVIGIIFYFSFGINYHKRQIYSKKLIKDETLRRKLEQEIISKTEINLQNNQADIQDAKGLVNLLLKDSWSPLTSGNKVKLLLNGEEKFPELLSALEAARHHIHLEYYVYENDTIGNQIKDILIRKAQEGVQVRFIYDDFGSRSIRKKLVSELRNAGVEAYPFNRIKLLFLANRLNYRNHRKIIIVDGKCAFVGGINISDRYINKPDGKNERYWRDTHLRIDGPGIHYLQYLFFCDWNFCARQQMQPQRLYFNGSRQQNADAYLQIAASGPDSPAATVMLSIFKAINLARKEILITTPYFIPGESLLDALKVAALSGVSVKILTPGVSDSRLANAAAWSYYGELMDAGVRIYLYQKGFVHAKTIVVDGFLSVVGTANMDARSFELNFEVNALVYGEELAMQLVRAFANDVLQAEEIMQAAWTNRSGYKRLLERTARLLSPLL